MTNEKETAAPTIECANGHTVPRFQYECECGSMFQACGCVLGGPCEGHDDDNGNRIDGYTRDDLGESPDW